jgi:hypothetical protein
MRLSMRGQCRACLACVFMIVSGHWQRTRVRPGWGSGRTLVNRIPSRAGLESRRSARWSARLCAHGAPSG